MLRFGSALVVSLFAVVVLGQQSSEGDLIVDLTFTPQEAVQLDSLALPQSLLDLSVEIHSKEARKQEDAFVIGTGSDDDDRTFSIRASSDVAMFVGRTIGQIAEGHGLTIALPAARQLDINLSRFTIRESNKALGSTYSAEVHFGYTIRDSQGKSLSGGNASGTANRYGKSRSGENISEVLSDALKDAFVSVLEDQNVQMAWISGKASTGGTAPNAASPTPRESTEEKLKKLDDLLEKGLITREEHRVARAKVLEDV